MARQFDDWIMEDLAKSGLTPETINVELLLSEQQLQERLGFTAIKDKSGNWIKIYGIGAYWIPYPNVPGYYRLKLHRGIMDEQGNNIKYLSPKKEMGFGNHPYILSEVMKIVSNYSPDKPVYLVEGEKKATKATLEGFPCIGLSGVWSFKDSESDFLTGLDQIVWTDRTAYIVFDSDIVQKHSVKHAEIRLAVEIINRGGIPFSIRLPQ